MEIIVNILGLALIIFIIWWFWIAQTKARTATQSGLITVLVKDGVYTPSRIEVQAGEKLTLVFKREDPNPCAEKVVFNQLNLHQDLNLHKDNPLELSNLAPGKYDFNCQMGMYRGQLIVR
ncbi:MAG: cupredoxin domain-containing protein [Gammaproteobacteria bacterium]|nr:cupredoxin domain-containing protein [Gammaproteobacteria bacterium]